MHLASSLTNSSKKTFNPFTKFIARRQIKLIKFNAHLLFREAENMMLNQVKIGYRLSDYSHMKFLDHIPVITPAQTIIPIDIPRVHPIVGTAHSMLKRAQGIAINRAGLDGINFHFKASQYPIKTLLHKCCMLLSKTYRNKYNLQKHFDIGYYLEDLEGYYHNSIKSPQSCEDEFIKESLIASFERYGLESLYQAYTGRPKKFLAIVKNSP